MNRYNIYIYICSISLKYLVCSLKMSLTTPLIFLDGIYRINYIPLIYHLIDLEHTTIPLTYRLFSQGLDSRSFPSKICRCLQIFGIQDSRFWGKVLESKPLDRGVLDASQGLDSRTFPQNLESWIQENLQTFANFWDSRFKIQGFEEKFLNPSP